MEINGIEVDVDLRYSEMNLSQGILKALDQKGFTLATPVQAGAIPCFKDWKDVMAKAPTDPQDLMRFIDEIPYWTARQHGKKYRLMYQVYTHPKYIRYGKQFFEGVNRRYTEYAKSLEPKLGIPYTTITPLIFILIQTCVHYAMFEDEYYLQSQLEALKQAIRLLMTQYRTEDARPDVKAES